MSKNKRLRVLKNIAGCLLLVSVLHYVLDEPTRSALIRTVSRQWNPPSHKPSHTLPRHTADRYPPAVPYIDWGLLRDASFERWDMQSYPTLKNWFTVATISAWDLVKKETEPVHHGRSAVRLEDDGAGHCGNVRQELPKDIIPSLRGHQLKLSVWALSTTPGAPCVRIDDGMDRSSACLQNPRGTWERVSVDRTLSLEATRVLLIIDRTRDKSTVPVYVDDASLTESPPSSEAPGTIAVPVPLPASSSERR